MMRFRESAIILPFIALLCGCATLQQEDWYNKAHDATVNATDVAKEQCGKALGIASDRTKKALERMQHYLAEKNLLKTFHVAGDQSEAAIGDFLHKAGIGGRTSAGPPTAAKPLPALAPTLPEHYSGDLQWPLEAGTVSSKFGQRWGTMHKGNDIDADVGEPVYVIADGDVIYASDGMQGYGNLVILRHDRQLVSLYAHNGALKVKVDDHIKRGSMVALLGNSAHSTRPHVHFEIRDGGNPVDPRTALPPSKLADTGDPAVDSPQVAQLGARYQDKAYGGRRIQTCVARFLRNARDPLPVPSHATVGSCPPV